MTIGPRIVLDDMKFSDWLKTTFNMQKATAAEALQRITEIDPLNETVTVDGQEHHIPAECYVDLFDDDDVDGLAMWVDKA